jgi:hypothetical protein
MRRLGQHRNPPPALPDGALPVPHQHPRHPAELVEELPPAGKQVLGHPRRQQPRGQPAGIAGHHHQHRQPGRRAGLAEPHRQGDIGKPQVALGHLPAAYAVRDAGSGGRYTGRSSRTRSLSTVSDRVQPTRSAITVAGIVGHAASSSRMRGSTASTIDPPPARRSYRGGPTPASARFTVFLEQPITLATCLIGIPSARYSRRISA